MFLFVFSKNIFYYLHFFLCRDFFLEFSMKFGGDFSVFVSHVNMIINQNKTKTYHKEIFQKNTTYTYICTLVCTGIHVFVSVCGRRWIPQNATLSLSAKKSYYKKSFSNYSANITYPAVRISASTSSSSPSTLCLYTNLFSSTLVFPFIQNERTVYFKDRQTTESFAKKQHH